MDPKRHKDPGLEVFMVKVLDCHLQELRESQDRQNGLCSVYFVGPVVVSRYLIFEFNGVCFRWDCQMSRIIWNRLCFWFVKTTRRYRREVV